MKKVTGMMAGLMIAAVMTACGEASIENVDSGNTADGASETDETEEAGEDTEEAASDTDASENGSEAAEEEVIEEEGLSTGDTVDFNGLHVTVKEVRRDDGDGDWMVPDNDFFLILDVSIENTTEESANVSTLLQMNLLDPSGYSQDIGIFADTRGSLDGEVGAGRTMAGEIAFDVEEADFYEFLFEDPFMSGQAIWMIEEGDWN
ncbi:DUF4352 domain-containing protein [Alteribacter natronophilus]|uniref:DUF4352 domain-containing protein n=1 Tax=Alteribacter natronophilus TaxID=2583810 RepID=UPI00110DC2AF|nr:DUF4352 domain-containing protein [Alteribacter natronophilus]TMW70696.1 DUF4352 domain-containing protein [Alteribacter natronophilus]